jgi:alpha-beta hydrolase superfamily lysophospholipase
MDPVTAEEGAMSAASEALPLGGAVVRRLTMSDGVEVHCLVWPAVGKPAEVVVVFAHGIASHGAWFAETAAWLAARGVTVFAPDRRGSGRSGGRRGHLARYERALADIDEVVEVARSDHGDSRMFLAASSWAAKLAVVYAAGPGRLDGLLLLGPGLFPSVTLSPAARAWVLVGHLVAPTSRVAIPLSPEQYTANERYRRYIRTDPLRLHSATTRYFWETLRLDRRRQWATSRLELPMLVLQGDADAMMDVTATRRWLGGAPSDDTTYRDYAGAGHTLDFESETNRGTYRADLLSWLLAHGGLRPTGA